MADRFSGPLRGGQAGCRKVIKGRPWQHRFRCALRVCETVAVTTSIRMLTAIASLWLPPCPFTDKAVKKLSGISCSLTGTAEANLLANLVTRSRSLHFKANILARKVGLRAVSIFVLNSTSHLATRKPVATRRLLAHAVVPGEPVLA